MQGGFAMPVTATARSEGSTQRTVRVKVQASACAPDGVGTIALWDVQLRSRPDQNDRHTAWTITLLRHAPSASLDEDGALAEAYAMIETLVAAETQRDWEQRVDSASKGPGR